MVKPFSELIKMMGRIQNKRQFQQKGNRQPEEVETKLTTTVKDPCISILSFVAIEMTFLDKNMGDFSHL